MAITSQAAAAAAAETTKRMLLMPVGLEGREAVVYHARSKEEEAEEVKATLAAPIVIMWYGLPWVRTNADSTLPQ